MYFVGNCKIDGMNSGSTSFIVGSMGSTERLSCDRHMFV